MLSLINIVLLFYFSPSLAKVTYFNLENTYGPYCNPNSKFTPDAGIVRYAGTPWIGKCVLNIESCCLPMFQNGTLIPNLSISTRFYLHLLMQPLCSTENVTIKAESGEMIIIDCNTKNGSEYYFDTERLTITYYRTSKLPLSKFSMVVTPLKMKTRMYTACAFDCFSDTYCIDRSLVCDRYKNCPNNVDEANCEYSHQHEPLSLQAKIILFFVLLIIITFTVSSIIVCYFCCGAKNNRRLSFMDKERKSTHPEIEETGAVIQINYEKNSAEGSTKTSFEKQLTRELIGDFQSRQWSSPAISNLNYHSLHSMHVHGNQNPSHTVRRPLTESQQIGWWIKDTPLKINEPWTQEKHHVHAQSEMTKFVDTLMLTDRSFRLF